MIKKILFIFQEDVRTKVLRRLIFQFFVKFAAKGFSP